MKSFPRSLPADQMEIFYVEVDEGEKTRRALNLTLSIREGSCSQNRFEVPCYTPKMNLSPESSVSV